MIELTVKTLDSQNHAFTVPDDTTVKQLKERIAESISFPVESQRLIYCGRVLQDEKNLSEYDVNGKVIHLVQRPPPQATRGNGGQQQRRSHHFRQPRLDGNAMYLGAMAFPADLMDSQGIQMPPSSHSLSNSRLLLARRMLRRAATVLTRLENPGAAAAAEGSEPDSPPEEAQPEAGASATASAGTSAGASASAGATASASAAAEGGSEAEANADLAQGLPFTGSIAQAAHAATAAAIAAAVSAVQAAGVPNITIVRSGQAGHDVVDVHMEGEEDPAAGEQPEAEQGPAPDAAAAQSSSSGETAAAAPPEAVDEEAEADPAAAAPNEPPPSRPNNEVPRPVALAELLEELARVNARLQPFMQQYQTLLEEDPSFAANRAAGQEAQRLFGSVSEIMHLLSHAYHALSDIMCDFQEAPPRALRCRPVLIQHSAVLQAGIPIQAQINVMTNRNAANNNNNISSSTNNNGAPAEQQGAAAAESEPSEATGDVPSAPRPAPDAASPAPTVAAADSSTAAPPAGQEQPRGRDSHSTTESAFNITPGNVEFFMEVGPGSITIDSLEATVVTSAGGMGSDGLQANVVGGSFPWGAPPPPEFIQNLMQAVAGHMMGGRGGTGSSSGSGGSGGSSNGAGSGGGGGGSAPTNSNSGSGAAAGAAGSGQNSQARGNTATHPTTATQTRSTSRPHVHLAPATMHSLGSSNFDPFLPCNSHHIRPRTRPSATQAFHQQFPLGMAASGGEPPVPGESEVPSAPSEAPPPAPAPAASGQPNVQPQVHSAGAGPAAGGATGSGPTPAAPSQAQAQQAQQVTAGLFNMLSSMFGGMPTGPQGAAVNLSSLFQPPGGSGQRPGSGSAQASAAASMFPGGMAFFNLGGGGGSGGGSGRPSGTPSHSSQSQPAQGQSQSQSQSQRQSQSQSRQEEPAGGQDMLTQLLQSLGNVMGADVLNPAAGEGSLVDFFLQGEGAHSYQPGSSLFLDFTMTVARHMSFSDIIGLSFGNGEPLNRIRPQLRQFVLETAYEGQPVTPASTARVVERIIREMRPQMHVMQQARLREDVDLVTTTIRYNQIRLPEVLALMVEGSEAAFGPGLVRWFSRYVRELSAIILHCCLDGEQGLDQILRGYVMEVTRGIHPAVQMWTVNTSVAHMQTYVRRQSVPFEEIRTFLVYRVPPVVPPAAPPAPRTVPSEIKTDSSCPEAEPMDTDPSPAEAAAKAPPTAAAATAQAPEAEAVPAAATPTSPTPAPAAVSAPHAPASAAPAEPAAGDAPLATSPKREPDSPLPALAMEAESLPDVVLGSEAWHNVLPSDWVPIIARDSQRQRRQGSQPPFSDAYLSGMPSKRRKVVTAAKPQGSTNQIISESMRSALDEAGVRPVAGVETAGEDLELQAAYREQVRAAVQESLAEQADFSAERFPNATKYFK